MTNPSVSQRIRTRNTFVSPLADCHTQGRLLYIQGKPITDCMTDGQAQGYLDAEAEVLQSDVRKAAKAVN